MDQFIWSSFIFGSIAACLTGLSKTGVPGVSMPGILLMTLAFPGSEKESTGAVLPLLILGDFMAIRLYRKNIQWDRILLLAIPVLLGIAVGAVLLKVVSNDSFKPILGILVLGLVGFEYLREYFQWNNIPKKKGFAWFFGSMAGFTTMFANAGGPPMNVYMASQSFNKEKFMSTLVWFFFLINATKLPLSLSLGMINPTTLLLDLKLLPALIFGAIIGRRVFLLIPEAYFVKLVLLISLISAIGMVIPLFL